MRTAIWFLLLAQALPAQEITGVSTQWSNSFVAWDLFTTEVTEPETDSTDAEVEEVKIGEIKQRWLDAKEDWTEWDFEIQARQGTIKLKWKNDPSSWELRTFDGDIVTMKTIWSGDFSQWRIANGDISLDFKSRYTSDFGEWNVTDKKHGSYKVAVQYANDPRDWVVTDELSAEIPVSLKAAMVFIVIYNSSPKK
jgi:hypothetical protein